jgi:GNAT superfamily N-acetyltransferase
VVVKIFAAQPADASDLRELHAATWAVTFLERLPEAWSSRRLAEHRARDWADVRSRQERLGGEVLAASRDGRIVGLCQYGPTEDSDDNPVRVGQIQRLYVDPTSQRTGVGRSLLATAADRLCAKGMSEATLWTLDSDERARAFYEALGWQPDGAHTSDGPATDARYRLPLASEMLASDGPARAVAG